MLTAPPLTRNSTDGSLIPVRPKHFEFRAKNLLPRVERVEIQLRILIFSRKKKRRGRKIDRVNFRWPKEGRETRRSNDIKLSTSSAIRNGTVDEMRLGNTPWEMYEISRVYTRETGNSCGTASFNLTRYIRAARWFNACSNALIYRQPVRLRKIEFPRSCAALISRQRLQWKRLRDYTLDDFDDQIRVGKYPCSYYLLLLYGFTRKMFRTPRRIDSFSRGYFNKLILAERN